ncbi:MAG: (deoxy)nucleoside triphosphate pyrophosphohydrolase [Bacteroidales bacterium]|nr:(deoxy)nucleoside triphosphate pyrophosphohydrolase [Bacteroidales bacterium]
MCILRTIEVVAAIIINDGKILATQRGYGEWKGWWEFPGGKIEAGETEEIALVREIREELAVTINIKEKLTTVEYDYTNFHLTMHCYICDIAEGELRLLEHEDFCWLEPDGLKTLKWLPADEEVAEKLG